MIIELNTAEGIVRGKPVDITNSSLALEGNDLQAVYRVPHYLHGKRVRWVLIEEVPPPKVSRTRTVLEWAGLVTTDETSQGD